MARKPLKAAPPAQNAAKAAEIASRLAGNTAPAPDPDTVEMETASYNLPVELIELCRELADERLKVERAEKRAARKAGIKPPQARRSASKVVWEAIEANRHAIEAEIAALKGE